MRPELWLVALGRVAIALCLLPAAATAAELLGALLGLYPFTWLEGLTGPLCHHDPARTLAPSPVCARCTGLGLGASLGGILGVTSPLPAGLRPLALLTGAATVLGLGAAVAEAVGWIATPNGVRLGLGAALGVGLPTIGALGGRLLQGTPRD